MGDELLEGPSEGLFPRGAEQPKVPVEPGETQHVHRGGEESVAFFENAFALVDLFLEGSIGFDEIGGALSHDGLEVIMSTAPGGEWALEAPPRSHDVRIGASPRDLQSVKE